MADIVKKGFLIKQGGRVKSWKERWCVLAQQKLVYYPTKEAENSGEFAAKGFFIVRGCRAEESAATTKKPFAFHVIPPLGGSQRVYVFSAPSASDRDSWIEAINQSANFDPNLQAPEDELLGTAGGEFSPSDGVIADDPADAASAPAAVESSTADEVAVSTAPGVSHPDDSADHMSDGSNWESESEEEEEGDLPEDEGVPYPDRPQQDEFVQDNEGILTEEDHATIKAICERVFEAKSVPIVVCSVGSLGPLTGQIEQFAARLYDRWKIGVKEYCMGLLLLVSHDGPEWHFAIRQGKDWCDINGDASKIDQILSKVLKEHILPALMATKPYNGSRALVTGVKALESLVGYLDGQLKRVVKPKPEGYIRKLLYCDGSSFHKFQGVSRERSMTHHAFGNENTGEAKVEASKTSQPVTSAFSGLNVSRGSTAGLDGEADGGSEQEGAQQGDSDAKGVAFADSQPAPAPAAEEEELPRAADFVDEDFPPRPAAGSFVNDTVGILSHNEVLTVEDICRSTFDETKVPIAVCTVHSTGPYGENIQHYAAKLFDLWGLGVPKWSVGLLLLCVRDPPKWNFAIRQGRAWADVDGNIARVDAITNSIMNSKILRTLTSVRPLAGNKAILAGVQGLAEMASYPTGALRTVVTPQPPGYKIPPVAYGGGRSFPVQRAFGGGSNKETTPFPPRLKQGSWFDYVQDLAGMLDAQDRQAIRRVFEGLFNSRKYALLFVSMKKLAAVDEIPEKERGFKYATALFNHYGVGHAKYNAGVLVFVCAGRHPEIVFGADWPASVRSKRMDIVKIMVAEATKTQSISSGIVAGVRAVERIIETVELGKREPRGTRDKPLTIFEGGRAEHPTEAKQGPKGWTME